MSDFETRRRRIAIRPGHTVTAPCGNSFTVEHADERFVCLDVGQDLNIEPYYSRRELQLSADQLTEEDEQRLAAHEHASRRKFAKALSPLLQTYTFDRLNVHAGNRAAFEACQGLEHGDTLFIHGAAGNGKTMLAVATAHRFAPYYTVEVWGVVNLFSALRRSFNPHAQVERPDFRRLEVLVLDDIGKTKPSDFVFEELYGLINQRLEHGLTTIFTSNHSLSETALKVSPDPDNLGAIVSRLASGTVVEVKGRDQRVLRGRAGAPNQEA